MTANRSSGSGRRHDNVVELATARSRYAASRQSLAASIGNKGDEQRARPAYSVLIVLPTLWADGPLMVGG
jgi:hypothetical protein